LTIPTRRIIIVLKTRTSFLENHRTRFTLYFFYRRLKINSKCQLVTYLFVLKCAYKTKPILTTLLSWNNKLTNHQVVILKLCYIISSLKAHLHCVKSWRVCLRYSNVQYIPNIRIVEYIQNEFVVNFCFEKIYI